MECRHFNLFIYNCAIIAVDSYMQFKHAKTQRITSAIFINYSTEQQHLCYVALRFRIQIVLWDGMLLTESGAILKGDWGFTPIQFT
jgi:hypothetical protein